MLYSEDFYIMYFAQKSTRHMLVSGFLSVLHEAVSTGNPEMVQMILQHRDYQQTAMTLGGVPELLQKINEVII